MAYTFTIKSITQVKAYVENRVNYCLNYAEVILELELWPGFRFRFVSQKSSKILHCERTLCLSRNQKPNENQGIF